ncbi:MAG: DUF1707 domain-containing protein [Nocardiopsaceae bacterium]|jgi:hypothetical protein|nr:DUF1707 domain-containing protein [Nocardiopsaceae bacterium]
MMDDRIRISDADRERVTARLREHFAEGRLTSEELDERVSAALNAKTYGDLRGIMSDLPEASPVPPTGKQQPPPWAYRPGFVAWRGPRLLPIAIVLLIAAIAIPGLGWMFAAFLKVVLIVWLVACIAGLIAGFRFRRRLHRHWESGWNQWQDHWQNQWQGHWRQWQRRDWHDPRRDSNV